MAAIWHNFPRSLARSHNPISLIASLTGAECDQYTRKVYTSVARTCAEPVMRYRKRHAHNKGSVRSRTKRACGTSCEHRDDQDDWSCGGTGPCGVRIPAPSTMSSAFNVPSWGSGPWLLSQSRHHGKQSSTSSSYPLFSFCLVCGCFSCVRTRTSTTVHTLHLCAVYISYANPSCVVFFGRSMPRCCCRCHRTMQLTSECGAV